MYSRRSVEARTRHGQRRKGSDRGHLHRMESKPAVGRVVPRFPRRWWESNPLDAALQAAATPCDLSVEGIFDSRFSIGDCGTCETSQSPIENHKSKIPIVPARSRTWSATFAESRASTTLQGPSDFRFVIFDCQLQSFPRGLPFANHKSPITNRKSHCPTEESNLAGHRSAGCRLAASKAVMRPPHPQGICFTSAWRPAHVATRSDRRFAVRRAWHGLPRHSPSELST